MCRLFVMQARKVKTVRSGCSIGVLGRHFLTGIGQVDGSQIADIVEWVHATPGHKQCRHLLQIVVVVDVGAAVGGQTAAGAQSILVGRVELVFVWLGFPLRSRNIVELVLVLGQTSVFSSQQPEVRSWETIVDGELLVPFV